MSPRPVRLTPRAERLLDRIDAALPLLGILLLIAILFFNPWAA